MRPMTSVAPLPAGTRLFHVGPHKTGTSAVQAAFHQVRETLPALGAAYPDPRPQAYRAAVGLLGTDGQLGSGSWDVSSWDELVGRLEDAGDLRAVVSSESFCALRPEGIQQLGQDVGHDRTHVVRMVRRFDKLIPSFWQQRIVAGVRLPFDTWLSTILDNPDSGFWYRQAWGGMTRRWVEEFGPDRVSVVVVDETDHRWQLEVFEQLLGLPAGALPLVEGKGNRSLNAGETELLRSVNGPLRAHDWNPKLHFRMVRMGASRDLKAEPRDPAGAKILLPPDRLDQLRELTERQIEELQGLGVRIIGDLDLLRAEPATSEWERPSTVPASAAAAALHGVVQRVRSGRNVPVHADGSPALEADAPAPGAATGPGVVVVAPGPAGDHLRARTTPPGRLGKAVLWWPGLAQVLVGGWQQDLLRGPVVDWEQWLDEHGERWADQAVTELERARRRHRSAPLVLGDAYVLTKRLDEVGVVPGDGSSSTRRSLLTPVELQALVELGRRPEPLDEQEWQRFAADGAAAFVCRIEAVMKRVGAQDWPEHLQPYVDRVAAVTASGTVVGRHRRRMLVPDPENRITSRAAGRMLAGALAASDTNWTPAPR